MQQSLPTVKVLHDYSETSEGYVVIHLEALDSSQGLALNSPELIASANPEYRVWAANALERMAGKGIPAGIDTTLLKRHDERNASAEKFWETWDEAKSIICDALPFEQSQIIAEVIEGTKEDIEVFITQAETPDKEYFVHNDVSPGNTFFDTAHQKALILDYEHAGSTHNKLLAWITDVGNFYARSWPNQEMQQEYLKKVSESTDIPNVVEEYKNLKGAVVFSSIFLAKFAMQPEHTEHSMAVALLNKYLETVFQRKKNTSGSEDNN